MQKPKIIIKIASQRIMKIHFLGVWSLLLRFAQNRLLLQEYIKGKEE